MVILYDSATGVGVGDGVTTEKLVEVGLALIDVGVEPITVCEIYVAVGFGFGHVGSVSVMLYCSRSAGKKSRESRAQASAIDVWMSVFHSPAVLS